MDEKILSNKGKSRKYSGEKLLTMPGINEAIDLVREHAWVYAVNETMNLGVEGQLGDEVKNVLKEASVEALDKFLSYEIVNNFIDDSFDEWLDVLAFAAGSKIAELWGLSEAAGRRLAAAIYWEEYKSSSEEAYFSPLVLLVKPKGEKEIETLKEHQQEFQKNGFIIISTDQIQIGHIYLDVTELTYPNFRLAYKAVDFCRKYLKIKKKDLQAGAPSNIDTQRALDAIYLKNRQEPSKNIAKKLRFKIYTSDNPSGSYSLLRKYFKVGKEIEENLIKLDTFLSRLYQEPKNSI